MNRLLFAGASLVFAGTAALFVACSSDDVDNTVYLAPDSGPVTTYYCIRDLDCQIDGGSQDCGFSIADGCSARGICVDFSQGAQKCPSGETYCGCAGGEATVSACGVRTDGYVRGGPTDGTPATTEADGSTSCK